VPDRLEELRTALGPGGPVRFARAPGRVNLIGEHTDYQEGFCLPMAIDLDVIVGWRARDDDRVVLRSLEFVEPATFAPGDPPPTLEPPWARPAAGVARVLHDLGRRPVGIDAVLSSTVPVGGGLSSSAALEVAMALALAAAADFDIGGDELALAAQRAEHLATGVPCGVMDQMSSVHGRAGHAVLLDCRTLATTAVPMPAGIAVVVVHCGVPRTLAGSEYAQRRSAVEAAGANLGLASLRDASPEMVADNPFARHVVGENRRVLMFVAALRRGRYNELGRLMLESHASLRDDFDVSTPALDALVDALVATGAIGARLTGAGFGGCAVALCHASDARSVADDALARYRSETGNTPVPFIVCASDGARVLEA